MSKKSFFITLTKTRWNRSFLVER